MNELPIDAFIPEIVAAVRGARAAVITAAPGAGKTTRVPPALAADGSVIVLQPRRVAARSLANRIAAERGWTIGAEVGWHVRFERQFGERTKVLFATEGILTARLQQDPLLTGFQTIVLDEFHERSIHADLGIALARQAWLARADLRLVVMSATLDSARVSSFLGTCPVIDVPGALHPTEVRYAAPGALSDAVATCLNQTTGQVLCFLQGAGEIDAAMRNLTATLAATRSAVELVPLHGTLPASAQDAAIAATAQRRVILATNIAETSLTVPGVAAVVDAGLHKVARYDPHRAVDSLETERISKDAADQRAGRAGRLGPGLVIRLWSESDRLRSHREPDIHRIDLSRPVLDILAWGGDPHTFEWFERPASEKIDAAFGLLDRLGATGDGRLTDLGRRMQRLPVSPRLSAILLAAQGAHEAALACALLSERHYQPAAPRLTTTSDLLSAIEREHDLPQHIRKAATVLQSLIREGKRDQGERKESVELRRALLAGYPDRVARRRAPGSARALLSSAHGAVLGPESGVREAEYFLALDVTAGRRGEGSEARIRMASAIDPEWLRPTHSRFEHTFDRESGTVRAAARDYYDALVLVERPGAPDPTETSRILAAEFKATPLGEDDEQIARRLRFAGLPVDPETVISRSAQVSRSLGEMTLARGLTGDEQGRLDRLAPVALPVPSGRQARLHYEIDGTVTAAVKLQELFGLADTPRVGPRREPVLFSLLAPNGRPVQLTRDLRSFWARTYPEVRKELRGRYPKHPWPEDPWTAPPTSRTSKRGVKER
jgi:ATP-dependent helicase HrpB